MGMYVRDLALRSRIGAVPDGVVVVDLADERSVAAYLRDRPQGRAIGFYPHVQRELAELARTHGIEPVTKREFFADPARFMT